MIYTLRSKVLLLKGIFLKKFGTYFFASILNRALPFLLLPLLTSYLTPEAYGTIALFQVVITFFVPFIGWNMQVNITRNFFQKSKSEISRIIFLLCFLLACSFIMVVLILTVLVRMFPSIFSLSTQWVYIASITAVMLTLNQFNLAVLRNEGRAFIYGTFEIVNTLVSIGVTIYLIVGLGFGWEGRAWGIFIAPLVTGSIGLIRLIKSKYVSVGFERKVVRGILTVSIPLIPHALGMAIILLSDRIFLDRLLGKEAVGIYAIGYQFGMIVAITTDSFNKVWSPWMYTQLAQISPQIKRQIVRLTYLYDIGILFFAVIVSYISFFLIDFMTTKDYSDAKQFVIWVALGYALRGMYMMRFPYLVHVGRTGFLGMITAVSAIVNLVANYILIQSNGVLGAAQATLFSFAIQFVGVWWYSNKIYSMPWLDIKELSKTNHTI